MTGSGTDARLTRWGALAGGLAHEIKNPLSTMTITLQLLSEDLVGQPQVASATVLPRIETMLGEVQRLERVLGDFLRLANEPGLAPATRDPNRLVAELVAFLEPETERRGVRVTTHLDARVALARFDPDLVRQALVNLVRNAMDAMPEGGDLTLQVQAENGRLAFVVIDTGAGIGEELLPRIFDGFFSTKVGGNGIGLALTRQIAELHQGEVLVESAPGHGSRFILDLPLERVAREEDSEATPGAPSETDTEDAQP